MSEYKTKIYREFEFNFSLDSFLSLNPSFAPLLRREKINQIFKKILDYFPTIISPIGGWIQIPMEGIDHDKVVLKDGIKLGGGPVAKFMVGCEYAIIMGCTIGEKFDLHLSELQNNRNITEATLLDALGSWTVSNCREQLEFSIMDRFIELGYKKTPHCEPGSTEWPIKEQKIVFSLLDGESLGIRLADSMMMYPSKSVTSMFGIGRGKIGIQDGQEIKCQYCANREKCEYGRKTKEKYPSKV